MSQQAHYVPGPARDARVNKDGETWTLVVTRELRHPPEKVWVSITVPAHLREWAPFDADQSLASAGASVKLTTVGAPKPTVSETKITRAEAPKFLEYNWGGGEMRWELEATGTGTRLTLWHNINKNFISMGAAGWHVCFDVLNGLLGEQPIGRTVGPAAMQINGWQQLHADYAKLLDVPMPSWG